MKTNNREMTDENAPAVKVTSGRHESDSWPTPTEKNTLSTE